VIIVGLVLLAAAVAAAVILIVQNRASMVHLNALGHTWSCHLYWVLVAGLIIALVGVLGVAVIRGGVIRARRRRRERAQVIAENTRPSEHVGDPEHSSFFAGDAAATDPTAPGPDHTAVSAATIPGW
jgi:hypothetical protein